MQKKNKVLTVLSLCVTGFIALSLFGCSGAEKVKVTYLNGNEVLKEVSVKQGETIKEWTPTKVDGEFFGWNAEPTLKHEFDFSKPINQDTKIFGSFVKYQKDDRKWGIAGSGTSSVLKESNWGKVFTDRQYMTNASTDSKNIFKITLNLFKGDEFQFTSPVLNDDGSVSWGHQRGAAYLVDPIKDGVEYFKVGGSLGGDNSTANITVAKDGKYELVLTTYPAGDFQKDDTENLYDNRSFFDKFTYTYLGESDEAKASVEISYYMKGELITGWGEYQNANTLMKAKDGKAILENVYLVKDDQFMFASKVKDLSTGDVTDGTVYIKGGNLSDSSKEIVTGANNMSVTEDGYYTFIYDPETTKLEVKKVSYTPLKGDYYIDGSFCNWGGAGNAKYMLVQDKANPSIYKLANKITLKEGDEVGLQYFDAANKKYNGFFSSKNMKKDDNFNLSANNAKCMKAGDYSVEFDSYSHLLYLK